MRTGSPGERIGPPPAVAPRRQPQQRPLPGELDDAVAAALAAQGYARHHPNGG